MQLEIKKWKTIEINKESDKCGKKNSKIKKYNIRKEIEIKKSQKK